MYDVLQSPTMNIILICSVWWDWSRVYYQYKCQNVSATQLVDSGNTQQRHSKRDPKSQQIKLCCLLQLVFLLQSSNVKKKDEQWISITVNTKRTQGCSKESHWPQTFSNIVQLSSNELNWVQKELHFVQWPATLRSLGLQTGFGHEEFDFPIGVETLQRILHCAKPLNWNTPK